MIAYTNDKTNDTLWGRRIQVLLLSKTTSGSEAKDSGGNMKSGDLSSKYLSVNVEPSFLPLLIGFGDAAWVPLVTFNGKLTNV